MYTKFSAGKEDKKREKHACLWCLVEQGLRAELVSTHATHKLDNNAGTQWNILHTQQVKVVRLYLKQHSQKILCPL